MRTGRFLLTSAVAAVMLAAYVAGYQDAAQDQDSLIVPAAQAAGGGAVQSGWSPTKPYPSHEVYYPGTEELQPEEMRVIACGSGMPMPRTKQAAACFLIELGNGDKFVFDIGYTGPFTTLYATWACRWTT